MRRFLLSTILAVGLLAGTAHAEEAPKSDFVKDESTCSNILQGFNGFQLVEVHVDPETLHLQALYLKKHSAHKWELVLLTRDECNAPYVTHQSRQFDPKPPKCAPGAQCI